MRFAVPLLLALASSACTKTGTQVCPSPDRPSARSQLTAVLVPTTNEIYAFGGIGDRPLPFDELWRWSFGACGGWVHLQPDMTPGPRSNYAVALDDSRHRIVYINAGSDVWALDTDKIGFSKLLTTGTAPAANSFAVGAYDAMHDRIVYAGIETYTLDFAGSEQGQWSFAAAMSLSPPASGAVDPTRGMLIARDQVGLHGFRFLTSAWQEIAMSGDVPPVGSTLVWDDYDQALLALADRVYVGTLDGNGTNAVFAVLENTTNDPPPRTLFTAVVSGNTLWLWGGVTAANCTLDDLWTLDLSSRIWTNVWPATTCM
ncbi:MAG: Kelch repeat-containing protein [Polyangia bacterium]